MTTDTIEAAARSYGDMKLTQRPGYLIRRLHQIHLALFAQECAAFDTTPLQSSVLTIASQQPGLEQSRLAEAIGVDRATLAQVVARLESRGLVVRSSREGDRRLKLVSVTKAGAALLRAMAPATARAHALVLAPVSAGERAAFLDVLVRLVEANEGVGRTKAG